MFINEAFDYGFKMYLSSRDNKESLQYISFMSCVVQCLVFLYGEEELLKVFISKNEKQFDKILNSTGYSASKIKKFKNDLLTFYQITLNTKDKVIKDKNKYFIEVEKDLIDMFILVHKEKKYSKKKIKEFKDILYTLSNDEFYKKTYTIMMADDPSSIEDYFDKCVSGVK